LDTHDLPRSSVSSAVGYSVGEEDLWPRWYDYQLLFRDSQDPSACSCPGAGGSCYGECGRKFDAAEVATVEAFQYGRFEACFFPNVRDNGTLATFFLYKNDSDKVSGATWQEIDFEIHGRGGHTHAPIQTNMITGSMGRRRNPEMFHAAPGYARDTDAQIEAIKKGFHHFAVEWTPEYVAWFFDEQRIRHEVRCGPKKKKKKKGCRPSLPQLNETMNVRMSVWPLSPAIPWAKDWAGILDEEHTKLPITVYYDYVKVYNYDSISKGFVLKWADDFTSFNTSRWEKSTHTWGGNYAHMRPDKAVIVRGHDSKSSYLSLSIAPAGEDITVPAPQQTGPGCVNSEIAHLSTDVYTGVCDGTKRVVWQQGVRYEGGYVAFVPIEVFADDDAVLQCAATCDEVPACRVFSVHNANTRTYCSGFIIPERQVKDETANGGVVCMDEEKDEDRL